MRKIPAEAAREAQKRLFRKYRVAMDTAPIGDDFAVLAVFSIRLGSGYSFPSVMVAFSGRSAEPKGTALGVFPRLRRTSPLSFTCLWESGLVAMRPLDLALTA